jgi:hypothetical protein
MRLRLYLAGLLVGHVITYLNRPVWAVPGLWCMECAMRRHQ